MLGTTVKKRQSVHAKVLGNHVNYTKQLQSVENINTKENSDGNQIDGQTLKYFQSSFTGSFHKLPEPTYGKLEICLFMQYLVQK